jgi:ATP phosphoribosyltransferase regulatory subunit
MSYILADAVKVLSGVSDSVTRDLEELKTIADKLSLYFPSLPVSFDLSELLGYHYHTGRFFAAFIPKLGREIARGGRYDNIGEFFGRARAATGFSADLKLLSSLSLYAKNSLPQQLIYAPFVEDSVLVEKVRDLRAQGIAVIQQLPGHPDEINELACTDRLEKENQTWVVKPLS